MDRLSFEDINSFSKKNGLLKKTVQEVIKIFRNNYLEFGKVTDQDLISLHSLFGETFEKALNIVDDNKVTYFCTKGDISGIYQVEGSSSRTYTVYPSINYCPCLFYKYQVANGSHTICKHVLAIIISDVIGKKEKIEVTDEHFRDLILSTNKSTSKFFKNPLALFLICFGIKVIKMNNREDWDNTNPYLQQVIDYSSTIPPAMININQNNWAQIPPQTMPWGVPIRAQPSIVRFTAGNSTGAVTSVKRKSDSSVNLIPAKILVTEEKMAAHMRSLHISDIDVNPEPQIATNLSCKNEAMETERLPKLVISDEIKNFKTEPIIPESILKNLEKPEMALVLWQPPPSDLTSKLKELKKMSKTKVEDKGNKNDKNNDLKSNLEEMEIFKEDTRTDVSMEAEMENSMETFYQPINSISLPSTSSQYYEPSALQFNKFNYFNSFISY